MAIHPTAIVDPAAQLDSSVEVGAYSLIGPHVKIGAGTQVGPHVVIEGHTTIGRDNTFFQFSSIGAANQDKKYAGEPTTLVIGDRNTIREFCTLNIGTIQDRGETTVGNDNWIMAYCHLAHDCVIGNQNVLANGVTFAGHVHVGDWVTIGGLTGILQRMQVATVRPPLLIGGRDKDFQGCIAGSRPHPGQRRVDPIGAVFDGDDRIGHAQ